MDDLSILPPEAPTPFEAAEHRDRRIAREAIEIAQARASAAAGRVVDSADAKAWIDSIGTGHELPVPYPRS